jgi:hypothetical protein
MANQRFPEEMPKLGQTIIVDKHEALVLSRSATSSGRWFFSVCLDNKTRVVEYVPEKEQKWFWVRTENFFDRGAPAEIIL